MHYAHSSVLKVIRLMFFLKLQAQCLGDKFEKARTYYKNAHEVLKSRLEKAVQARKAIEIRVCTALIVYSSLSVSSIPPFTLSGPKVDT